MPTETQPKIQSGFWILELLQANRRTCCNRSAGSGSGFCDVDLLLEHRLDTCRRGNWDWCLAHCNTYALPLDAINQILVSNVYRDTSSAPSRFSSVSLNPIHADSALHFIAKHLYQPTEGKHLRFVPCVRIVKPIGLEQGIFESQHLA
jgi:hypothetical protein